MKSITLIISMIVLINIVSAQSLKPYVLAFESNLSISELNTEIQNSLIKNDFEILGHYQPANDQNRWVIIITNDELKNSVNKIGGLSGFAASMRIAITNENNKRLVSYTNPAYWSNAYFQDDYDKVSTHINTINKKLISSLEYKGQYIGTEFGAEEGIKAKDLRDYHYMMGMPYFEDNITLKEFDSYKQAISTIESNIKKTNINLEQVYRIDFPEKELSLLGFGLGGENGESSFLPIIDISNPKHTAAMPYEILVNGKEVLMLHGRYRIALSFPDLTMGTFSKIMSTPGDIEELLEQAVE